MAATNHARRGAIDATRLATPRTAEVVGIALLTLVAAWMRLRHLGALSMSGDEGFTFLAVRGVLEEGIPRLPSGAVYWKSLLYTYLASGTVGLVGVTSPHLETALRLPAALASTALVPMLWWAGRRMFSPPAGLAAATVIALHVWQVEMSRYARYYPLLELTLVAFVERCHAVHVRGDERARVGLVIWFVMALTSHTIALSFLVLYVPLLAMAGRRAFRDRGSWAELAILAVIATGWLAFESRWEVGFVRRPDGGSFGAITALTSGLRRWSSQFFRWLPVLVPQLLVITLVGGALWGLLAFRARLRPTLGSGGHFAIALGSTVVAVIGLLGFGEAHAVPRYLFYLLPFGALLAGATSAGAGSLLVPRMGRPPLGRWFGAFVGAAVVSFDAHVADAWRVAERSHADHSDDGRYRPSIEVLFTWDTAATGRYVAERRGPGDRVLGTHPVFAYAYAGRLDGWIWSGTRELWDAFHQDRDGRIVDNYVGVPLVRRLSGLTEILAEPGAVWIVTTPSLREPTHVDPAIARFLARHAEARVFVGRDGISEVYRFEGRGDAPPREIASLEVENLPAATGHAESRVGASGDHVRSVRGGIDVAGELASARIELPDPGRYAVSVAAAGDVPGAGVLVQALRSRRLDVLAERFVRLPTRDISLTFATAAPDSILVRVAWDGAGTVAADRIAVVRAPAHTVSLERGEPLTVACLGDSITALSGYPAVLETLLCERLSRPVRVYNHGRPGANARELLEALSRDDVLGEAHADVVLIQLGTNDARVDSDRETRDDFRVNLTSIVARAKRCRSQSGSPPRVALATVPPIRSARPPFGEISAGRVDAEINPTIREVARSEAVELIDPGRIYDATDALEDGIHPTLAIAERLAAVWADFLTEPRPTLGVTD